MIYLDNAATSFPKPPCVAERMHYFTERVGATMNRSVYGPAQDTGLTALELRERLCRLFSADEPSHAVITSGATAALNLALLGALRPGDRCLCSAMEHNAVARPLSLLQKRGVEVVQVPCEEDGTLRAETLERYLRAGTRLFVMAHASNVSGTVQDAARIGRLLAQAEIPFVLDASQSAGHVPVDFKAFGLSALAVPGHKGLLGPAGIGALLLERDFAQRLEPILCGGTGSCSDSTEQPEIMPDKLEPGTPNLPGIYGLHASLGYLSETGLETIFRREQQLTRLLLDGLRTVKGIRLVGPTDETRRVGVISVDFLHRDNADAADALERRYGILTRCGLHCAPWAHRTLGTFPRGTVRFSLGLFNTEADIDSVLEAVEELAEQN